MPLQRPRGDSRALVPGGNSRLETTESEETPCATPVGRRRDLARALRYPDRRRGGEPSRPYMSSSGSRPRGPPDPGQPHGLGPCRSRSSGDGGSEAPTDWFLEAFLITGSRTKPSVT